MNRLEQIEARLKAGYHQSVKDTGVGSISAIALADAEADLADLLAVARAAETFLCGRYGALATEMSRSQLSAAMAPLLAEVSDGRCTV